MISFKDYAEKNYVSYETVRRHVSRHKEDLEGHIVTENGIRYLDDFAEEYIDNLRKAAPIVVVNEQRRDEYFKMQEERDQLRLDKIALLESMQAMNKQLAEFQAKFHELEQKNAGMLEDKTKQAEEIELLKKDIEEKDEIIRSDKIMYEGQQANMIEQNKALMNQRERLEKQELQIEELTVKDMNNKEELLEKDKLLRQVEAELQTFEKTIFGFYRKKK